MYSKLFSFTLVTLLVCGSIANSFTAVEPRAYDSSGYFWDEPVKVKQPAKPKPGRRRAAFRPAPDNKGEELSPLLTIKYQVLERGEGNLADAVDASQSFKVG